MDLLTVARRANLGSNIRTYFANARARLATGVSCSRMVAACPELEAKEHDFYQSTYIIGLVAAAEGLLSNLTTEYLVCYPEYLNEKNLSLDLLADAGSILAAIEASAEKTVHEWSYGRFPDFVQKAFELFGGGASIEPELMSDIAEIAATRDMYVHANGIVNRDYLASAGARARTGLGRKLEVGSPYLTKAEEALGAFIDQVEKAVPDEIKALGKVSAFRTMWDATSLARLVPFDRAWLIEGEDSVQPNEDALAAGWSHTQQMLLEFFRSVADEYYGGGQFNVAAVWWRFAPSSNEAKVITSWVAAPFWF